MKRSIAISVATAVTALYLGAATIMGSIEDEGITLAPAAEYIEMEPIEITANVGLDRVLIVGDAMVIEARADGSLWGMAQP